MLTYLPLLKMGKAITTTAALAACVFLISAPARATTVTIDFEALATSPPASPYDSTGHVFVFGTPLDNYLASFGVSLTNVTPAPGSTSTSNGVIFPGTNQVFVDTDVNNQIWTDVSGNDNFLTQNTGGNPARSYTLAFDNVLDSFSFTQRGVFGLTGSGIVQAAWTAQAFDASNNLLGAFSKSITSTYTSLPAETFSFTTGNIKSIVFTGNHFGFAGTAHIGIDDLVMNFTPVPEPATLGLLLLGLAGITTRKNQRRS